MSSEGISDVVSVKLTQFRQIIWAITEGLECSGVRPGPQHADHIFKEYRPAVFREISGIESEYYPDFLSNSKFFAGRYRTPLKYYLPTGVRP